jgi:Domain of unknown function (DUF4149)
VTAPGAHDRVHRVSAWSRLLASAWFGALAAIAFIAAPSAFATLARPDAGRYVTRLFGLEAWTSLVIALLLLFAEQRRARADAQAGVGSVMSGATLLLLGTLFCTVLGRFGIEPMMAAARNGDGAWSFGALHAASTVLYALKALLALALAWHWQWVDRQASARAS